LVKLSVERNYNKFYNVYYGKQVAWSFKLIVSCKKDFLALKLVLSKATMFAEKRLRSMKP